MTDNDHWECNSKIHELEEENRKLKETHNCWMKLNRQHTQITLKKLFI